MDFRTRYWILLTKALKQLLQKLVIGALAKVHLVRLGSEESLFKSGQAVVRGEQFITQAVALFSPRYQWHDMAEC